MNERNQRNVDTTERIEDSNDRARDSGATDAAAPRSARVERGAVGTAENTDGFLPQERLNDLRGRWEDIQVGFVDDPRGSVRKAHDLVRSVVDDLTKTFTSERDNLEGQWNSGQVETEDLRVALQRYRAFFNRLLAT